MKETMKRMGGAIERSVAAQWAVATAVVGAFWAVYEIVGPMIAR